MDSAAARATHVSAIQPSWSRQYAALCRKHWLLAKRNWASTLAQCLMGLAVCLLLLAFQGIANVVLSTSIPHPGTTAIGAPPPCVATAASTRANGDGTVTPGACNTLLYAPVTPDVERVMRRVAGNTGLQFGTDIAPVPGAAVGPVFDLRLVNASLSNATTCVVAGCALAPTLACLPCALARDNATLTAWLLDNPASAQNAVWFVGAYLGDLSYAVLYNFSVTIYPFFASGHSLHAKRAIDQAIIELALEDAASGGANGTVVAASLDLRVAQRPFPVPVPRLVGYQAFAAAGGQWAFVVPMAIFFSALVDIVQEKESRLRVGMRQMGLKTSAFWAAWYSQGLALSVLSTAVFQSAGYAMGFDFFVNSTFAATALMFLMFNVAMLSLAVLLSTLVSSTKTAQTVGYSVVLLGFVFQFILTSAYAGLVDLLYSTDLAPWVLWVRRGLTLYPAFNFSLLFYDISAGASSTVDPTQGKLVQGPGFHWADMFAGRTRAFAGFTCNLPPPVESLYQQALCAALFTALALYLDTVLAGPHGSPSHPLFFLGCSYHTRRGGEGVDALQMVARAASSTSAAAGAAGDGAAAAAHSLADLQAGRIDAGVTAEAHYAETHRYADACSASGIPPAVANAAAESFAAVATPDLVLRVSHLRVVYRSGWSAALLALTGVDASTWRLGAWSWRSLLLWCRCIGGGRGAAAGGGGGDVAPLMDGTAASSAGPRAVGGASNSSASGDVVAVRDLSFAVRRGEIFALLGHNGCGKSSTISSLTGLFTAAAGEAEVMGLSTTARLGETQRLVGVCPQHDILWPALGAAETLRLFAAIKGLPPAAVEAEVHRVLVQVRLLSVAQRRVGGFSGGMKRRLSVAIAVLGAPKLIFLDEPTTGMDPVNRLKAWRVIQDLKREAAVVLTTHNMAEANILGTRVGVMAGGALMALGTPLRLKQAYGAGYRLDLVLRDAALATLAAVRAGVASRAPEAALTGVDAANASFTVPFAAVPRVMPPLLDWIEAATAHDGDDGHGAAAASAAAGGGGGCGGGVDCEGLDCEGLIREHGVSGPTLESVFIAISAAADFDLAKAAIVGSGGAREGHCGGGGGGGDDDDDDDDGLLLADDASPLPPTAVASGSGSINFSAAAGTAYAALSDGDKPLQQGGKPSVVRAAATGRHSNAPGGRYGGRSYSYRALCIKNLTIIVRQRGLCLCQLITPMLVLGLLVLLQVIIRVEAGGSSVQTVPSLLLPLNQNQLYPVTQSIPINGGRRTARSDDDGAGSSYDDDAYGGGQPHSDAAEAAAAAADGSDGGDDPRAAAFFARHAMASGVDITTSQQQLLPPLSLLRASALREVAQALVQRQHGSAVLAAAAAAGTEEPLSDEGGDDPLTTRSYAWEMLAAPAREMARTLSQDAANGRSSTGRAALLGTAMRVAGAWMQETLSPAPTGLQVRWPTSSVQAPPSFEAAASPAGDSRVLVAARAAAALPSPSPRPVRPRYPPGYDVSCLTFFLFAATADGTDGNSDASLAEAVGAQPRLLLPWPQPAPLPTVANVSANATGLLGAVATNWCQLKNFSMVPAPFFSPRGAANGGASGGGSGATATGAGLVMDDELMGAITRLNNASNSNLDFQPPCWPGWWPPGNGSTAASGRGAAIPDAPAAATLEALQLGLQPYDPVTESYACPSYLLPDATVDFHAYAPPVQQGPQQLHGALAFTLQVNDLTITRYHRPNNFSRLGLPSIPGWVGRQALTVEPARLSLMDMLVRAYATHAGLLTSTSATAAAADAAAAVAAAKSYNGSEVPSAAGAGSGLNAGSTIFVPLLSLAGTFPVNQVTNLEQFVEVVGAVLHPITLTLQLPLFVFIAVMEKEERLVELQHAMGLRHSAYAAVTYGLNLALYLVVSGAFWAAGRALQFTFFTLTSPLLLAVALLGWGLALCSLAALVSAFLWSRTTATVAGYCIALFGNLFAIIVAAGIYGSNPGFSLGSAMPLWLYLFPIFGLVRFLYLGTFNCIALVQCYDSFAAAMAPGSEIRAAVLSLYLDAALYLLAALYLDQVLPRRYGVPRHPLFCVPRAVKRRAAAAWAAAAAALGCACIGAGAAAASSWAKATAHFSGSAADAAVFADTQLQQQQGTAAAAAATTGAGGLSGSSIATRRSQLLMGPHRSQLLMGPHRSQLLPVSPSAAPDADDESVGAPAATITRSLFAFVGRWARLLPWGPGASFARGGGVRGELSTPVPTAAALLGAATADYAAGEDADVAADRELVEGALWPRLLSLRAAAATAAASPPGVTGPASSDPLFDEYPVILRHVRKEFATQAPPKPPAQRQHPPASSTAAASASLLAAPLLGLGGSLNSAQPAASAAYATKGGRDDAEAALALLPPPLPVVAATVASATAGGSLGAAPYEEEEQRALGAAGVKVAVSDMTLAVARDTCFGLLGENGAGKSTLIAMLMGLYPPSAGVGFVSGHDIEAESTAVRRSIGVCLQQDVLWANLTCAEHLAFYARVKGVPPAELGGHVAGALARVGLSQFAARRAGDLSGGMRRRLSLAVALTGDSALVLADEVTTGLDPGSKRAIWRIIERSKAGRVWLLVSHDMAEIETLCGRIGIMTCGRLRALGSQERLKRRYGGGIILQVNYALGGGGGGDDGSGNSSAAIVSVAPPHAGAAAAMSAAAAAASVAATVQQLFPGARVDNAFIGFASFVLPTHVPATAAPAGAGCAPAPLVPLRLSRVFEAMQAQQQAGRRSAAASAAAGAITDWQVSQVSLDVVFSRIVRHYRAGGRSEEEEDDDGEEEVEESGGTAAANPPPVVGSAV